MSTVKSYLSLIKFSHTIFAMPFALIGFFLGVTRGDYNPFTGMSRNSNGTYQWNLNKTVGWEEDSAEEIWWKEIGIKFLLVIFCMVLARSAAMAFNRYLD